MKNFLFSCLDKTDPIYTECIDMFMTEANTYATKMKVFNVIKDREMVYLQFIVDCYVNSGSTPSKALFEMNFPDAKGTLDSADIKQINASDLRVYMFNLIDARVNAYIGLRLNELNTIVKERGITSEISTEFDRLQKLSNRNKAKEVDINIDSKKVYEDMKLRPLGMITGIKAIDDKIGGMNSGTVTTIAGFTSQYKTTFALNISRINAYYLGYNIAYLSLETPKTDMKWNLLSSHSYEDHLSKYMFIGHDRMRKCMLTPDEEDYLFNVVAPDLEGTLPPDDGQEPQKRGKIVFLDESDFNSFSFGEISAVLEQVDDKLKKETGAGLDAIVVDYIQLCKFSGTGVTKDANSQINSYVTFFRRLGQSFRKEVDDNGNESVRQLIMILLSQINRENWKRARNNEGRYDITCLADANELERGSYRVFTTFTNEEMKGKKSAQVQILKNRTGQTMYDPSTVYADGEAYVFCDEDGMNKTFGGDATMSMTALFSDIDDLDMFM